MDVDDSYSELGLSPTSTDAEVKAAWRRLAARWHPDRNASPQALRKIQRINRALEEIQKARRMDGDAADDTDTGTDTDTATDAAPPAADARKARERDARPTACVHHTVRMTLEEAAMGCTRELDGEVRDDCAACGASGVQPQPLTCPSCAGAGRVRQPLWFGWASQSVECSACDGQGAVRLACPTCDGQGRMPARVWRGRIEIAPGVRDGDVLAASARTVGPGGRPVKLAVHIALQPHAFFRLEADGTVCCEVPVDGFAWVGNRWTEVPTLGGAQQMRLRHGHRTYRIRGQGFPAKLGGERADCLVTVVPLFPEEFSSKQESLIDKLVASNTGAKGSGAARQVASWEQALQAWRQTLPQPPDGAAK